MMETIRLSEPVGPQDDWSAEEALILMLLLKASEGAFDKVNPGPCQPELFLNEVIEADSTPDSSVLLETRTIL